MAATHPRASIFDSEEHLLKSKDSDRTYHISIWLPPSYKDGGREYPVVYLLDSDVYFGAAANLGLILITGNHLPEFLLVGVGYGIRSYDECMELRMNDLTPTSTQGKYKTGGADSFLAFVEHELIPYVDASFRTKKGDRAIIGHSAGGLFVMYTMFQRPHLFNRCCAATPAPRFDDGVLFRYEEEFSRDHSDLSARLVITVGSLEGENVTKMVELYNLLKARRYPSLRLDLMVFENETHQSVVAPVINKAWPALFQ